MSLASRLANILLPNQAAHLAPSNDEPHIAFSDGSLTAPDSSHAQESRKKSKSTDMEEEEAMGRKPYVHCMIAGGLGGTTGDMLMHSVDTVKTRQQGDPYMPPRYGSMSATYAKIFRQEGFMRGLYSGVMPALLGSFPGTLIFFGIYEYTKRSLLDCGLAPSLSYLTSGFLADLAASVIYVPSEVVKTRLQLQGRHNNPFFSSGYNYRGTSDALRTIMRTEGLSALFYGYKATIFRDLPFSALQFAFYEQEQDWARRWAGGRDIGLALEVLTASTAGGLAGIITCPLDVVKTRIQTQINPSEIPASATISRAGAAAAVRSKASPPEFVREARRGISTSSPSTTMPRPGSVNLDTSSVVTGLRRIYQTEGLAGWFRGVGPRAVWTSVQSGTMLVCYQALLRQLERNPIVGGTGEGTRVV